MLEQINTQQAPSAIGTYSQAIKAGQWVYISGQIPLVPETMTMVEGDIFAQIKQVLDNLNAVVTASGASLSQVVKLNIYLCDLADFQAVNEMMSTYFSSPFPARAAVQVAALPKGANVEMDAVVYLG